MRAQSGQVSRARLMPNETLPPPRNLARCWCDAGSVMLIRSRGSAPRCLRPEPGLAPPRLDLAFIANSRARLWREV
jgi:hypothetical protein